MITQLPTRGETWNDPIYLEGGHRRTVDNRYASPGQALSAYGYPQPRNYGGWSYRDTTNDYGF